jgi:rod shape-determining protein MreD
MTTDQSTGRGGHRLSFLLAFLLAGNPPPGWLGWFWPDWVAMVLIYWCMALPHRIGMGVGWLVGLLVDVGRGALLGQHAWRSRPWPISPYKLIGASGCFHPGEQTFSVLIFLLTEQVLVFWISGVIGYPPRDGWYLAPAVGGMVLWPLLFVVLRDTRRYFQVTEHWLANDENWRPFTRPPLALLTRERTTPLRASCSSGARW